MNDNKYLPIQEYQKTFPVDHQIADLPFFITSKDIVHEKTHIINARSNMIVQVSNKYDSIPRDFDQKVYFALVQVSIDFKNKLYSGLFKKLQLIFLSKKMYDFRTDFNDSEQTAITYKLSNIKTLSEKIDFIIYSLTNLDNEYITPIYHLSQYNKDLFNKFLTINSYQDIYAEIINKLLDNKVKKSDLNKLNELKQNKDFIEVCAGKKLHDLIGALISSNIDKHGINFLLNDYDFLHAAEIIPTEIYFTYYEIMKYIGNDIGSDRYERIKKALDRLRDTKYKLWNCAYNAKDGRIAGMLDCSFITSIDITNRKDEETEFTKLMEFTGLTKASAIITVKLESFFISNLVERKGHILHNLNVLINMDNAIARRIYLYADKNRWWMGRIDFNTDKKIKLTLRELALRACLSIEKATSIPRVLKTIINALDYLLQNNHILSYETFKGKPQIESYFILDFSDSKEKDAAYIDPTSLLTLVNNKSTKPKTNKTELPLEIEESELPMEIKNLLTGYILNNKTIKFLCDKISSNGIENVKYAIEYTKSMKPEDYVGYLCSTLKDNHHDKFMKNKRAKQIRLENQHKNKIVENQNKENKEKLLKQEISANRSLIENNYYKLEWNLQEKCSSLSKNIIKKYGSKLSTMFHLDLNSLEERLSLCVYAVSEGKSYDTFIEDYLIKNCSQNLSIYKQLD